MNLWLDTRILLRREFGGQACQFRNSSPFEKLGNRGMGVDDPSVQACITHSDLTHCTLERASQLGLSGI